ncbi:MAG: L,D-transpeptidase [Prevotella sp.]|nr:L,D-transpeptidase [Prevotella sp.]
MRLVKFLPFVSCAAVCLLVAVVFGACQKSGNPSSTTDTSAPNGGLGYSGDDVRETVVDDYGKNAIRIVGDRSISHPQQVKDKKNCFIMMSKKDYYLYVYEKQGDDTVMVARYDACFSLRKGQKEESGDMRTPHCTMDDPFTITEIKDASTWEHDFGDGRGPIKSYGDYFLRLETGHKGIGIHGSTNNVESVPGRASEGCIRLHDEDIIDLAEHYAFVGMKVVIKAEDVDDLPFEVRAFEKQKVERKRHLDPSKTLSNSDAEAAAPAPVENEEMAPEDEEAPIDEIVTAEDGAVG